MRSPLVPTDPTMRDDRGNWEPNLSEEHFFERWGHRLRGLNVLLSIRSSRLDPKLTISIDNELMGPQERTSFKVIQNHSQGMAHVTTLIGSVETPNFYRGD